MDLSNLLSYVQLAVTVSIPILGRMIVTRLRTPSDVDRAQQLSIIANAAAALIVMRNPTSDWRMLLEQTIKQISAAAGLSTRNAAAIEREAAAALMRAGIKPGN